VSEAVKPNSTPCPRCHGRLFPIPETDDSQCFTCGYVAYAVIPEAKVSRGGSHLTFGTKPG
jgi:hypothetical protein